MNMTTSLSAGPAIHRGATQGNNNAALKAPSHGGADAPAHRPGFLATRTRPLALAISLALGTLALGAAAPTLADGHYVPGVEGMQAATVPPPGMYYLGYLVHYDIKSFRAPGSSDDLPGDNTGEVTALANRFVWISPYKVLGADWGMEAIVPVQHTSLRLGSMGARDSHTSMGDVYLGPLVLGWHGERWDAVAGAGVWLDNAGSERLAAAGKGFKSLMLTGGATLYLDSAKTTSFSTLMRFEHNGKDDHGFRPGRQLTMEWGLGRNFGKVQAGLVGYSQWQVSHDSGPGASRHKAARHAIGGELVYPIPETGVFLKGAFYREVSAKAGSGPLPKGNLWRLSLVKAF